MWLRKQDINMIVGKFPAAEIHNQVIIKEVSPFQPQAFCAEL